MVETSWNKIRSKKYRTTLTRSRQKWKRWNRSTRPYWARHRPMTVSGTDSGRRRREQLIFFRAQWAARGAHGRYKTDGELGTQEAEDNPDADWTGGSPAGGQTVDWFTNQENTGTWLFLKQSDQVSNYNLHRSAFYSIAYIYQSDERVQSGAEYLQVRINDQYRQLLYCK